MDRYLESEVLNADPVKLVSLLYRGALDAIAAARAALHAGKVPERSRQIIKAWGIVGELRSTLNHERGGEISRQLADLYQYVGQRLLEANAQQTEQQLVEAGVLLTTLAEAWQSVQAKQMPAASDHKPLSLAC